jgi:hypothetical protein
MGTRVPGAGIGNPKQMQPPNIPTQIRTQSTGWVPSLTAPAFRTGGCTVHLVHFPLFCILDYLHLFLFLIFFAMPCRKKMYLTWPNFGQVKWVSSILYRFSYFFFLKSHPENMKMRSLPSVFLCCADLIYLPNADKNRSAV